MVLRNNYLYNAEKVENHHYEELQEKDNRVFLNLQNNMQNNEHSSIQREDEINKKIWIGWRERNNSLKFNSLFLYISHSVVTFVEVDFLWNRTVDSLKTSFHLLLYTSSGLKK